MEPLEKCQNCGKDFPQSKINSHFSYCRRNIKRCEQCKEMVDINYLDEHNQDFHTKQNCKHCRKGFNPQQLAKHQGSCPSQPIFCEFCELDIAVNQYDKHVSTCGSRTKLCSKCQKNVMLREYDAHTVSCRGKPVQPSPQPVIAPRQIQKKPQPEVREVRQPLPITNPSKPETYIYKPENPQVIPANNKRNDPVITHNNPPNPNRVVSGGQNYFKQSQDKLFVGHVDHKTKEIKKQSKIEDKRPSYNLQQERVVNDKNDRYQHINVPVNNRVNNDKPPVRHPTTTTTNNTNQIRREPQKPSPIYQQRKQPVVEQRQKPSKPVQAPVYEPPVYNPAPSVIPDVNGEDEELQRAIYESMGFNKMSEELGGMKLPVDAMSQSFCRDLQMQDQIYNSTKNDKAPQQRPGRR